MTSEPPATGVTGATWLKPWPFNRNRTLISRIPATLISVVQPCSRALPRVPRTLITAIVAISATAVSRPVTGPNGTTAEVRGGRHRERGNGTAADDEEERPAEQEGREGPNASRMYTYRPPASGSHRAELGVGEGAQRREHAAHDPDQE